MSACLISAFFTIGMVLILTGFVIKTLFESSSKLAYYTGQVLFLAGGVLVAPAMIGASVLLGILVCFFILGVTYVDYAYQR